MTTATLPSFEGEKVVGTRLKINGLAGDPLRGLKIGERVFLVVEAVVESIEHDEDKIGITRIHKARINRYGEMDYEEGQEFIAGIEEQRRAANGEISMFAKVDDDE